MKKFNFSYDKENDDLFLFKQGSKSKGSIELGEFIVDYNNKKELVGVELINASKSICDIMSKEDAHTIKKVLNNLKECKVGVKTKKNLLIITIHLISKLKEIAPIIFFPAIKESSPALAYT